jgi:hypothetical protein
MRSATLGVLFSATAIAVACGNGGDRPPASLGDGTGGSGSAGKTSTRAGSSAQGDAGEGAEAQGGAGAGASAGGAADGGDGIDYEAAGAPSLSPGVCDPTMMPGAEEPQGLDAAGATLLSLTPDELSFAFVTGDAPALVLHVADRASVADSFSDSVVDIPEGYEAASGASLSSDGLKLVLVLADHSGFGMLSRAARGDAFGASADATAFAKINAQKAMSGRELGWPVLSADGQAFYYLSYFGQALVVQSGRGADGKFDLGAALDEFTLGGEPGAYKRINGLSQDQRAIFFYDEASQHAMALFRSRPNAPFYDPVDLGERYGAAPNATCTRIYSSVDGELVAQALK